MPFYAYECTSCGHEYELRQAFTAGSDAPCPRCGARGRRLIFAPMTIVYKGQGWKATHYDIHRDYFGLQKELRDVAEKKKRMKGSREQTLQIDEQRSAEADTRKQQAVARREASGTGEVSDK